MVKLVGAILSFMLVFVWITPVMAESTTIHSPQIENFLQLDELVDRAFAATQLGDFATSESYWTQIIAKFPDRAEAWSNRGNSRVSQNKLVEALTDYNQAIQLAPHVTDPYLNRGTALEGLGRWSEAIADYNRVLELDPKDAMAYNNRGNANAGLSRWSEAIRDYQKALEISPSFVFARANYALAVYETGQIDQAVREMQNIVRKYPRFADMRAALTAAYWVGRRTGEAESNWVAAYGLDPRYKDINWVKNIRRWPPSMVAALDKFFKLQ